jgi:hypothetical protein
MTETTLPTIPGTYSLTYYRVTSTGLEPDRDWDPSCSLGHARECIRRSDRVVYWRCQSQHGDGFAFGGEMSPVARETAARMLQTGTWLTEDGAAWLRTTLEQEIGEEATDDVWRQAVDQVVARRGHLSLDSLSGETLDLCVPKGALRDAFGELAPAPEVW